MAPARTPHKDSGCLHLSRNASASQGLCMIATGKVRGSNNIDTLRFLGAFFVLVGHTFACCYGPGGGTDPISDILKGVTAYHAQLPGVGVAMFFVLSGYLVTRSYLNGRNLGDYLEARILRIFPALWVTLLLTVLLVGPLVTELGLREYFTHKGTWNYLLHNFKLFPDIIYRLPGVFESNPRAGGVNGSLWTLPVEVRMYVLVALLGVFGMLRSRWVFNTIALLVSAWFIWAPEQFVLLQHLRHERLGVYFLLGALLYMNRDSIAYHWIGLAVLGVLVVCAFGSPIYNFVYAVWFSYLVLYLSFHPRLRLPDLGKYGDISYGLYLYAMPVTQLGIYYFGAEHPWLMVLFTFVVSVVLASLSWILVEKPALSLKRRLRPRLQLARRFHEWNRKTVEKS